MLVVLLLLILWPLAEIYVAILVAQALGAVQMLALVALSSIAGLFVLRNESRAAWIRFNAAVNERRLPSREVGDGLLGFSGGLLMLIPGLIGAVVGLLLILPPTKALARGLVAILVAKRFGLAGSAATWTYNTYSSRSRTDFDLDGSAEEIIEVPPNIDEDDDREPPRLPPS